MIERDRDFVIRELFCVELEWFAAHVGDVALFTRRSFHAATISRSQGHGVQGARGAAVHTQVLEWVREQR